ncbi:MAG: glycoside hydrolase family 57 protein [Candidatus Paceibacterota bacterium]
MTSVCFYFQVHQPYRVKRYRIFDIGSDPHYFNDDGDSKVNNRKIMHKVADKCYLPTNKLLLELLNEHPEFKISYSISGTALEQFEEYHPEVLESFKKLVATGRVEILQETYYHSLSFLYSLDEFREQVRMHRDKVREVFGVTPTVFRNTELIYRNDIAHEVEKMGYKGIIAEGADHVLGWRSPNFIYRPQGTTSLGLMLKNYKLSDDIAFRFGSKEWDEYPLTAEKFGNWVAGHNGSGDVINLFMDYETFGEHQWEDTGIFNFLRALPNEVYKHPDNNFVTPTEAIERYQSVGELDIPYYVSWADVDRDLSAWRSNSIQHDALQAIYEMRDDVYSTGDMSLLDTWRKLTTSDHFYYMCTKWFADGDVHAYFSPYDSPYEAFIAYMNALKDLRLRVGDKKEKQLDVREWKSRLRENYKAVYNQFTEA